MKRRWLVAMLGVACLGSRPDGELGTAAEPIVAAYAIAGVRRSPGTVHFTGLPRILNSSEATGPIAITTHVGVFVLPAMTTTVTGVDADAVSHAVGYNFSQRRDIIAVSTADLKALESLRVEAYASFEETLWEVRDASSGAPLGAGASFNPSGVFFQTVTAYHVPLPDMGLFTLVPGCEDLACALPPDPGGAVDAGIPESRARAFVPYALGPLIGASGAEASAPVSGLRY